TVFDKKATDGLNKYVPFMKNKSNWSNQKSMANRNVVQRRPVHERLGYKTTFVPSNKPPMNQWVHGQQRIVEKGNSSGNRPMNFVQANKYAYKNNYMGKNPMTRT
ncbi:hypothetical protein A2U01_0059979, partial [Trifolium medium]|nr:hypothetical protein [Trifolium medium]